MNAVCSYTEYTLNAAKSRRACENIKRMIAASSCSLSRHFNIPSSSLLLQKKIAQKCSRHRKRKCHRSEVVKSELKENDDGDDEEDDEKPAYAALVGDAILSDDDEDAELSEEEGSEDFEDEEEDDEEDDEPAAKKAKQ